MQVAVMVDRNQDGKFTCHPCTVSSCILVMVV